MIGAVIFYILCGIAGLAALFLIVVYFLEPDFEDFNGAFAVIMCVVAFGLGAAGWNCEREANAEYKTYTAQVEVIDLECSKGSATITFHGEGHKGYIYVTLDEYKWLEVGDTITLEVSEKIYEGDTSGQKTYKLGGDQ